MKLYCNCSFMYTFYFITVILNVNSSGNTKKVSNSVYLVSNRSRPRDRPESVHDCLHSSKRVYFQKKSATKYYKEHLFYINKGDVSICIKICCKHQACTNVISNENQCFGYSDQSELEKKLLPTDVDEKGVAHNFHRYLHPARLKRNIDTDEHNAKSPCTFGLLDCSENEFCKTSNSRKRTGVCSCKKGFERNNKGLCVDSSTASGSTTIAPLYTTIQNQDGLSSFFSTVAHNDSITVNTKLASDESSHSTESTTVVQPVKKLVVNISNKTVLLPPGADLYKDWVTLSAFALGDSGSTYKFHWNLVDKPDSKEDGSMRDINSQTISLSNLVTGVYIFNVSVTGTNSFGYATGNITVLPAKHVNNPPVAVIVPSSQTIKLPNSGVILDGSGSTDDKKVDSFHWELGMGPLGYKLQKETGPTLQMTDLIPGNYTVLLKVKDEEGLEGNTTASVVIVRETDYPPSANAGGDKIIYLPQTEIVLNGNMSTDDHEIVEWEWTKGPEDSGNAVDMQV